MKSTSIMVCVLPALAALWAGPAYGAGDRITAAEVQPYHERLAASARAVRNQKVRIEQVVDEYKRRARGADPKREKAINMYIYGTVLELFLKQPKEAAREYERALKEFTRFPHAYIALARLARRQSPRHARELVNKALAIDPDFTDAINALASLEEQAGQFTKAMRLYERSNELDPNKEACAAVAINSMRLLRDVIDEKERASLIERATTSSEMAIMLDPTDPSSHILRARVYVDLKQLDQAVAQLEDSYTFDFEPRGKLVVLNELFDVHQRRADSKQMIHALKRVLEYKDALEPVQREEYKRKIEQLEAHGNIAPQIWIVEVLLERLQNDGISPTERRDALRVLLRFYANRAALVRPSLRELRATVFSTALRTMVKAPAPVTREMMQFLAERKEPALVRVLVHFVYPHDDKRRDKHVRREAVRTLAKSGGLAVLPTLVYCLRDEPGVVVREVDKALAALCAERSPVDEGLAPFTKEQVAKSRRGWRKYFLSNDGASRMVEALAELRKTAGMDAQFNRSQTTKPMANHVAEVLLFDAEMPYRVWLPAYEFFRDYLNREFRPVDKRGTPVAQSERAAITAKISEFMNQPPPQDNK